MPLPPPSPGELREGRIHEVIRDYPELLPLLEEYGVVAGREGSVPLKELPKWGEELEEAILSALRWRIRG